MKDIVKRMNKEVATWEKMFANHLLERRFISRIYKELSKLSKKTIQLRSGPKTLTPHQGMYIDEK